MKKNNETKQTIIPFSPKEFVWLNNLFKDFGKVIGEPHRTGGFIMVKVLGVNLSNRNITDISSKFTERYGSIIKFERNNNNATIIKV